MKPQKEMPGANPSYQLFGGFNAFFSPTWQKTQVGLVSRKVFHVWCILGHPNGIYFLFSVINSWEDMGYFDLLLSLTDSLEVKLCDAFWGIVLFDSRMTTLSEKFITFCPIWGAMESIFQGVPQSIAATGRFVSRQPNSLSSQSYFKRELYCFPCSTCEFCGKVRWDLTTKNKMSWRFGNLIAFRKVSSIPYT